MNRSFIATFLISSTLLVDFLSAESCIIEKSRESGECKHIYSCPKVLKTYRLTKTPPQVCNESKQTVCCPLELKISIKKCKEYSELRFDTQVIQNPSLDGPPTVSKIPKCFHGVLALIVGGEEAKIKEFPHMALIGFGLGSEDEYQCGGSLISEQWILSAAHCVRTYSGPANFAKLGHVIRNRKTQNSYIYKIIERIKHPDYSSKYGDDDIALFKLEKPATLNDYVIPICLPDTDALITKSAITIGFGKTDTFENVSDKLMKVTIEYMDPDVCNEQFKENMKFANNIFDKSKMICAGSTNKTSDSCQGDSGGPLQIYHTGKDLNCLYQIVGITSFGAAYCGVAGIPAVYTKVYHYLDWIEENVWPGQ